MDYCVTVFMFAQKIVGLTNFLSAISSLVMLLLNKFVLVWQSYVVNSS